MPDGERVLGSSPGAVCQPVIDIWCKKYCWCVNEGRNCSFKPKPKTGDPSLRDWEEFHGWKSPDGTDSCSARCVPVPLGVHKLLQNKDDNRRDCQSMAHAVEEPHEDSEGLVRLTVGKLDDPPTSDNFVDNSEKCHHVKRMQLFLKRMREHLGQPVPAPGARKDGKDGKATPCTVGTDFNANSGMSPCTPCAPACNTNTETQTRACSAKQNRICTRTTVVPLDLDRFPIKRWVEVKDGRFAYTRGKVSGYEGTDKVVVTYPIMLEEKRRFESVNILATSLKPVDGPQFPRGCAVIIGDVKTVQGSLKDKMGTVIEELGSKVLVECQLGTYTIDRNALKVDSRVPVPKLRWVKIKKGKLTQKELDGVRGIVFDTDWKEDAKATLTVEYPGGRIRVPRGVLEPATGPEFPEGSKVKLKNLGEEKYNDLTGTVIEEQGPVVLVEHTGNNVVPADHLTLPRTCLEFIGIDQLNPTRLLISVTGCTEQTGSFGIIVGNGQPPVPQQYNNLVALHNAIKTDLNKDATDIWKNELPNPWTPPRDKKACMARLGAIQRYCNYSKVVLLISNENF